MKKIIEPDHIEELKAVGRPPKNIDRDQVERLSQIGCTIEEIATIVGCTADVLHRRFKAAIKKGQSNGKMSVRRKQYLIAMNDSHKAQATMLIWLGKQWLGQRDKLQEVVGPDESLEAMLEKIAREQHNMTEKTLAARARSKRHAEAPATDKAN